VDAESLVQLMSFSQRALGANLEGFTHQESLAQPPSGNCANWLLGHILLHRERMLAALGAPPAGSDEAVAERYDRGSPPVTGDGAGVARFESLRGALDESARCITDAVRRADGATLAADYQNGRTVGQFVALLMYHEGYHVGQIGAVRRQLGKPGAIR